MAVTILTPQEQEEIIDMINEGVYTKTAIAKKYGVHRRTIDRVIYDATAKKCYKSEPDYPEVDYLEDGNEDSFILTSSMLMVYLSSGEQFTVSKDNPKFEEIRDCVIDGDYTKAAILVDLTKPVIDFVFGTDLKVIGGVLYYNDEVVDSSLSKRIVSEAINNTGNVGKYINFFRKLNDNPSFTAIKHCYDFLVHNDLEITESGDIEAWKQITFNNGVPVDMHTQRVPNYQGWTVQMPRSMVEDRPDVTCSDGLHVAAAEYFGCGDPQKYDKYMMKVTFNPKNVVSVPIDYNNSKMRVCEYKIIKGTPHPEGLIATVKVGKNGKIIE